MSKLILMTVTVRRALMVHDDEEAGDCLTDFAGEITTDLKNVDYDINWKEIKT